MIDVRADTRQIQIALTRTSAGLLNLRPAAQAITALGVLVGRNNAPSRTGRLRHSIRGQVRRNQSVVTAGRGIEYAVVIDEGWRQHNIEADHFMGQARRSMAAAAPTEYRTAIADLIRRNGLK